MINRLWLFSLADTAVQAQYEQKVEVKIGDMVALAEYVRSTDKISSAADLLGRKIQGTINFCNTNREQKQGRTPVVVCIAREDYKPFLAALYEKESAE